VGGIPLRSAARARPGPSTRAPDCWRARGGALVVAAQSTRERGGRWRSGSPRRAARPRGGLAMVDRDRRLTARGAASPARAALRTATSGRTARSGAWTPTSSSGSAAARSSYFYSARARREGAPRRGSPTGEPPPTSTARSATTCCAKPLPRAACRRGGRSAPQLARPSRAQHVPSPQLLDTALAAASRAGSARGSLRGRASRASIGRSYLAFVERDPRAESPRTSSRPATTSRVEQAGRARDEPGGPLAHLAALRSQSCATRRSATGIADYKTERTRDAHERPRSWEHVLEARPRPPAPETTQLAAARRRGR
jgi:hypothetical protein